ncbi:hypothetical protein [Methylocystis sp. S23]|jgi:hypothetical protein
MNRKFVAAALVAPLIAFGPATAWAHHCPKSYKHHARGGEKAKYGSSKSMQNKRSGSESGSQGSTQNPNQGAGGGDQGTSGSSTRQGI